jgi:hypothetical protein
MPGVIPRIPGVIPRFPEVNPRIPGVIPRISRVALTGLALGYPFLENSIQTQNLNGTRLLSYFFRFSAIIHYHLFGHTLALHFAWPKGWQLTEIFKGTIALMYVLHVLLVCHQSVHLIDL